MDFGIDIETLKKLGSSRNVAKDEYLFKQNQIGDAMYFILSGEIGIIHEDNVNRVTLAKLQAGEVFGEMAFLDKSYRSASAKATKDSIVFVINHDNFERFIQISPSIVIKMMKTLSERIRKQNHKIVELQRQLTFMR